MLLYVITCVNNNIVSHIIMHYHMLLYSIKTCYHFVTSCKVKYINVWYVYKYTDKQIKMFGVYKYIDKQI